MIKNKWFLIGMVYISAVLFASVSMAQNLMVNGGFETGKTNWKSTGSFSITATAPNVLYDKQSASFTPSGVGQYLASNPILVQEGLKGEDCMVKISWKGADANVFLSIFDGTGTEIIPTANRATLRTAANRADAKVYFTCPSSGSISLRVQSTAAGVVGYYDSATIGKADSNNAATNFSAVSYTPITLGLGTPTGVDVKFDRVGDKLHAYGTFLVGTTSVIVAQIGLPAGLIIDSAKSINKRLVVGSWYRSLIGVSTALPSTSVGPFPLFSQPSFSDGTGLNAVFLAAQTNTGSDNFNGLTGTNVAGTGEAITFDFTVPIVGWSLPEISISSKCPNDIACENTFSAKVSAAGVVSAESLDFLNGNCTVPTGGYSQCNFNTGIFSVVPNCTVSIDGAISLLSQSASMSSPSPAGFQVYTLAAGTAINQPYIVTCQKAGSDFKAKQTIQGFLASTVTSDNNIRIEKGVFAGATDTTNCTASPCTVYRATSGVSGVTRSSTGLYAVNFQAGTFIEKPSCSIVPAATTMSISATSTSSTSFSIAISTDSYVEFICVGRR